MSHIDESWTVAEQMFNGLNFFLILAYLGTHATVNCNDTHHKFSMEISAIFLFSEILDRVFSDTLHPLSSCNFLLESSGVVFVCGAKEATPGWFNQVLNFNAS